jgi:hypothetical protein
MQNQNEPLLPPGDFVSFWEASDGATSRLFFRSVYQGKCLPHRNEHSANVEARTLATRMCGVDPLFQTIFHLSEEGTRISGRPMTGSVVWGPNVEFATVTHATIGPVTRVSSPSGGFLHTQEPECWIVDIDDGGFSIDGLKRFGDLLLPSSGRWESYPKTDAARYEILSAERFTTNPKDWFYEFPNGTAVADGIKGTITKHPFTAAEWREIQEVLMKNCPSAKPVTKRNWFLLINLALAVSVLLALAWKWLPRLNWPHLR